MGTIKKLIFKILCNNITGRLIKLVFNNRIPDIRWKGFRFSFKNAQIQPSIIASVFWGFYESAEIRFAEKYLVGNNDIVELGGSCGIVSAHLISKLQPGQKLISVEANDNLAVIWNTNAARHNYNNAAFQLLNCAVHYGSDSVSFKLSDNTTESRTVLENEKNEGTVTKPAISLKTVADQYSLDNYVLVSDIEGAEIAMLINDAAALKRCKAILIELHPGLYNETNYSLEELENILINTGFAITESCGPVYYFENKFTVNRN